MRGLGLGSRARTAVVISLSRRDKTTAIHLIKHLVGKRLIFGTLSPRLRRIHVTKCYERFYRSWKACIPRCVGTETDKDKRWYAFAAQRNELLSTCSTIIGLVEFPNMCTKPCLVVVVRDI